MTSQEGGIPREKERAQARQCLIRYRHIAKQPDDKKTRESTDLAVAIRATFNAPDEAQALQQLEAFIERYKDKAPRLAEWAETAVPESLAVFHFPEPHRRRLRTSNVCERLNKEIRRRTRVATLFPNQASCLRLVSAVIMETSEEWETGRVYLFFS